MGLFFIYSDCVVSEGVVEACGQGQSQVGLGFGLTLNFRGRGCGGN